VKQSYEWAGLEHEWRALVAGDLRLHAWNYGFILGLEQEESGDPSHGKLRSENDPTPGGGKKRDVRPGDTPEPGQPRARARTITHRC
jgi:hypothetical protein